MVEVLGHLYMEVKAVPEGTGTVPGAFDGTLSTYGNVDLAGDICEKGCFDDTLKRRGPHRPMLWQHDDGEVIGSFNIVETKDLLGIDGSFNLDVQRGREGHSLLKRGDINGLSIGYRALDYYYDSDGIRHLTAVDLFEGSLVTFPANTLAMAQAKSRRLARMSRYAKCNFLAKMSDEERTQALAELDEMDRTEPIDDGTPEPKPEPGTPPAPEDEPKQDVPDEPEPSGDEPDGTDEKEGEDEALAEIRALRDAVMKLLSKLEAPA